MVMVGSKLILYAFVLTYFCACANNSSKIAKGEFLSVTDSKPSTDSIYAERLKEGPSVNPRYVEFCFAIHNYSEEKMYLPIQTWLDSITTSSINVYFTNETDTIHPDFRVDKKPYDSNYICKGDSLLLFIKVYNFEKWNVKKIDVNTNIDTLISKLNLEYIKSPKDIKEEYEMPDIEFDKWPQFYYEIPRDRSVLRKNKVIYDRLLVRTRYKNDLQNHRN